MIARARVVARAGSDGTTRLARLRSDGPLVLRDTPQGLFLIGGAAGPLGGDDWHLSIDVGAGAQLTIRTVAASIALPGRPGATSRLVLEAEVGVDAHLSWLPEPLVAGAGCRHRTETTVMISPSSQLIWREELILGRHNEPGGAIASRVDFEVGSAPLLRTELITGSEAPGWDGPAVVGGMKAAGSLLFAGDQLPKCPDNKILSNTAFMELDGRASYVTCLAATALSLRNNLNEALFSVRPPSTGGA